MAKNSFHISEIKCAWKEYNALKAFCVLKNGKWEETPMTNGFKPPLKIEGTAAKVRKLSDIMDFPEYMDKEWVKTK